MACGCTYFSFGHNVRNLQSEQVAARATTRAAVCAGLRWYRTVGGGMSRKVRA